MSINFLLRMQQLCNRFSYYKTNNIKLNITASILAPIMHQRCNGGLKPLSFLFRNHFNISLDSSYWIFCQKNVVIMDLRCVLLIPQLGIYRLRQIVIFMKSVYVLILSLLRHIHKPINSPVY